MTIVTLARVNRIIAKPPEDQGEDYSGSELDDLLEEAVAPAATPLRLDVPLELAGMRLDAALAALLPAHSRSRLQAWIRADRVQLDGRPCADVKLRVAGGERIDLSAATVAETLADQPEDIPLDVVFEDAHILVLDKPVGLVAHPGSGVRSGTLLNALLAHAPEFAEVPRAGIVHRLDKDTSGLLVVAKTLPAQTDLVRQLQARTVKRQYTAVVHGVPPAVGIVDAPIGRHPVQRTKMAVVPGGRFARTHYSLMEKFARAARVECLLDTGRTHQIRVHMAHIGHPLLGDGVYAGRRPGPVDFPRQALHAFRLGLVHPATGRPMEWEIPLPQDMLALLDTLRGQTHA